MAHADHSATKCLFSIKTERYPITYLNESRQNPDGTYYPGDGYYYLIRYSDITDPGSCSLHTPIIETSNLNLNYSAVYRGEYNENTGIMPPIRKTTIHHNSNELTVDLTKTNHYYLMQRIPQDTCRHHCTWQNCAYLFYHHYEVYEKPFLSKKGEITNVERRAAKGYGTAASTDVWISNDWKALSHRTQNPPLCDMGKINSLPHIMYDSNVRSDKDILNRPTYVWQLVKGNSTISQKEFESYADSNSKRQFDERVNMMCHTDRLKADSGCIYGTVEIRPHAQRICLYDELASRGINVNDIPPNIDNSSYVVAPDTCNVIIDEKEGNAYPNTLTINGKDAIVFDFTLKGTYLTPYHQAGGTPIKAIKTTTKNFTPLIQDPSLHVILTKTPMYHHTGKHDGKYEAKNKDGTYYHNDPVYVYHEPSWKWKDERYKHINFTIHHNNTILPIEDHFHCINTTKTFPCTHKTQLQYPQTWHTEFLTYGNGDGMTIYNATNNFAYGLYDFAYNMTAYNINRDVAYGNGTTNATIVAYNPVYEIAYSYPVLADGHKYSYDNRRGIIMKYMGSWQDELWPHTTKTKIVETILSNGTSINQTIIVPSTTHQVATIIYNDHTSDNNNRRYQINDNNGNDVNTIIHKDKILWPERRSYINSWQTTNTAYDYYYGNQIDFITAEKPRLDEARNIISYDYNNNNSSSALSYADYANSIMFIQQGYGVALLEWPISDYVFGYKNLATRNYTPNITILDHANMIRNTGLNDTFLNDGHIFGNNENPLTNNSTINNSTPNRFLQNITTGLPNIQILPRFNSLFNLTSFDVFNNNTINYNDRSIIPHPPGGPRYENITSVVDAYSYDFAGLAQTHLYKTIMRYVDAPFTKQIIITSIDQNGTIQTADLLGLKVEPYNFTTVQYGNTSTSGNTVPSGNIDTAIVGNRGNNDNVEYLSSYIHDKIMHDTKNNTIITNAILDDTYDMQQEWNSYGVLNTTILRTSLQFADFTISSDIIEAHKKQMSAFYNDTSQPSLQDGDDNVQYGNNLDDTNNNNNNNNKNENKKRGQKNIPWSSIFTNDTSLSSFFTFFFYSSASTDNITPHHNTTTLQPQIIIDTTYHYNRTLSEINDIQTLVQLYAKNDLESFRLGLPYNLGLSLPSPITRHISINDTIYTYNSEYYNFGGLENITINARTDNIAIVETHVGSLIISQPYNFGMVKRVEINNVTIPYCFSNNNDNRCIIPTASLSLLVQDEGNDVKHTPPLQQPPPSRNPPTLNQTLHIILYNEWGGEAHAYVEPLKPYAPKKLDEPRWWLISLVIMGLILSCVAYKQIKKITV